MKILVTGASGFLGGRISSFFKKKKNIELVTLAKKKFKINFINQKKIEKICRGVDVVINCIGKDINKSKNRKKTIFANSVIPTIIYKAANRAGVGYFLFISTYHVYDLNKKKINERSKLISKNLYTESKILGEAKINKCKNKTKIIILRLCNLFGYPVFENKNCEKLLLNYIVKNIARNKIVKINSEFDQLRYYSSVATFNNYLFKLLKNLKNIKFSKNLKIFNYFTDKRYKISDLVKLIQKKKFFLKRNKIYFKNKNLKKSNDFKFQSLSKKMLPKRDHYFLTELLKTYNYYKKK